MKSIVHSLLLIWIALGVSGCSSAPKVDSNRSRIVLKTEDIRNDMTAQVSSVYRSDGSSATITDRDYKSNFLEIEAGHYSVKVECFKESNGGIYPSGSTSGTFALKSGELLRVEFMRDQALVSNQNCPILFLTNQ